MDVFVYSVSCAVVFIHKECTLFVLFKAINPKKISAGVILLLHIKQAVKFGHGFGRMLPTELQFNAECICALLDLYSMRSLRQIQYAQLPNV